MHIGPIPQVTTQYEVYVLVRKGVTEEKDQYQRVGLTWPKYAAALEFQLAYEQSNPHVKGKTLLIEKHINWTVISDYASDGRQLDRIPTQRGLQRQRSSGDTLEFGGVGA